MFALVKESNDELDELDEACDVLLKWCSLAFVGLILLVPTNVSYLLLLHVTSEQ